MMQQEYTTQDRDSPTPVRGSGIIWFRRGKIDPFGGARCLSGTVAKKSDKGPAYVPAKSILS